MFIIMQYVLCVSSNIRIVGIIVSIVDMSVYMRPVKGVWCTIASVSRKKIIKIIGGKNGMIVYWLRVGRGCVYHYLCSLCV